MCENFAGVRTLLLTICYDGSGYHGWQIQSNAHTVQAEFQSGLAAVLGHLPDIKACSRTDTGVHAREFCISFETSSPIPPERLVYALNVNLPKDIAAISCREVASGFHARYHSTGKRYEYVILNSPLRSPFFEGRAHHFKYRLDEQLLGRAAAQFVGTYDFSAFCSAKTDVADTVRTVRAARVVRNGDIVSFFAEADGFLYNMVRIMAGTLLAVAAGRIGENDIRDIILSKDRSRAGTTAPACGLYLDKVFYEQEM
ncbi:MAG: tRNA pseudouridine(38-40) synthase TruA [Oscillospiraceae bacterium]|jgi:tRNA pseudouridine38-40 synthase|nr:tRNA pseudouridine(38-40) synthase TruA [Oscillospiraceae bacterium]